jgi:addiction module HigA family antidote
MKRNKDDQVKRKPSTEKTNSKEKTWTIHPGEILREAYLKPLRMTPYRLARELHVPVPRINDIVLEKRGISADTAVRLAKFFGTTETFWLGMQADYDAHQARKRLQKELAGISSIRRGDEREFDALMRRLRHIRSGGPFSREEMNRR